MKAFSPLLALGTLLLLAPNVSVLRSEATQEPVLQPSVPPADRTPVLVELFTSEGCSTCPPADALLSKLESVQPIATAEVIGFEEHVDYWNHDGWVDSYSSSDWTLRQQDYVAHFKGKSAFTPQMVVDGERQFLGNNAHDALESIETAAHRLKAQISITSEAARKGDTSRYEVRIGARSSAANQETADVWMGVTEAGLETSVKAGENAGKDLRHAAILRSLHKIGSVPAKDSSPVVFDQQVKYKSNWKKENLRVVVFLQEHKSLHILGAATHRAD